MPQKLHVSFSSCPHPGLVPSLRSTSSCLRGFCVAPCYHAPPPSDSVTIVAESRHTGDETGVCVTKLAASFYPTYPVTWYAIRYHPILSHTADARLQSLLALTLALPRTVVANQTANRWISETTKLASLDSYVLLSCGSIPSFSPTCPTQRHVGASCLWRVVFISRFLVTLSIFLPSSFLLFRCPTGASSCCSLVSFPRLRQLLHHQIDRR